MTKLFFYYESYLTNPKKVFQKNTGMKGYLSKGLDILCEFFLFLRKFRIWILVINFIFRNNF
jgi:hypothetical protein